MFGNPLFERCTGYRIDELVGVDCLALVIPDDKPVVRENASNMPSVSEPPFEVSGLRLLFGAMLIVYYPHISMANTASVVLRRDPSARALIGGSVAALVTAMLIYGIWGLAINGAVPLLAFVGHRSTALAPLAARRPE